MYVRNYPFQEKNNRLSNATSNRPSDRAIKRSAIRYSIPPAHHVPPCNWFWGIVELASNPWPWYPRCGEDRLVVKTKCTVWEPPGPGRLYSEHYPGRVFAAPGAWENFVVILKRAVVALPHTYQVWYCCCCCIASTIIAWKLEFVVAHDTINNLITQPMVL